MESGIFKYYISSIIIHRLYVIFFHDLFHCASDFRKIKLLLCLKYCFGILYLIIYHVIILATVCPADHAIRNNISFYLAYITKIWIQKISILFLLIRDFQVPFFRKHHIFIRFNVIFIICNKIVHMKIWKQKRKFYC